MTNAQYGGLVEHVAEFTKTLGHLPRDCPYNYAEHEREALAERIREDTRKVTAFHPEIDPALLRVELTLEEVIKYGMQSHEIEFYSSVFGIIAERCYQTGEGANLADGIILLIRDDVYDEYGDILLDDPEAKMLTARTHGSKRRGVERAVEKARRLVSAFSRK